MKDHKAPRYLVLTELFLPTKGGTAVWFDEVYRRLGDKSTHIVTASVPGDREHDRDHPNTVHRIRMQDSPWLRPASLPRYLNLLLTTLWLGVRHRFDAIHAGRVLPEGLVAWIVARLTRRPVVIYAHGEEITNWSRSPRRRRAMTFAYRHADRVIANSEFTRDQLLNLGVDPQRIAIIHPGVDLERFHPGYETADLRQSIGLQEHQKLILSVGRLSRRKGFDQVIAALPALIDSGIDAHYAVVGIGEDREYLDQHAITHRVAERVHFLGHVEPADLPRWYQAADLFAMPNRVVNKDTEGFGMVYIEAAACGTPALAGCAGGTGSAVLDGQTGLRVDGDKLDQVTDALLRLLGATNVANDLGSTARKRAMKEFSWDLVATRTLGLTTIDRRLRATARRGTARR